MTQPMLPTLNLTAPRIAKCCYCNTQLRSDGSQGNLAFFEDLSGETVPVRVPQPMDRFYCGCRGWD